MITAGRRRGPLFGMILNAVITGKSHGADDTCTTLRVASRESSRLIRWASDAAPRAVGAGGCWGWTYLPADQERCVTDFRSPR